MLEELYKDLENIINGTDEPKTEPLKCPITKVSVPAGVNIPKTIFNMPVAFHNACKSFEVSEDNEFLIIDGQKYKIPYWYNRELIALRDDKTLQMILIHHGFDYTVFYNTS